MGGYQAYREAKPWNWRTADDGHAYFEVRIDVQVDGFESASQDIVIGSPGASETFYLDTLHPPKPQRPVQLPIVETTETYIVEESQPLHENSSKHSLRYFESDTSDYKPPVQAVGDLRLQTVPVDCMIDIAQLGLKDVRKSRTDWYIKNVPAGIYSIGITGLVPIKEPKTQNMQIAEKSRQFRLPIRTKAETYVLINLMTGEVKDIPAERLLARAREYAKQAERKPDIKTWRNVVRNAERALTICHVEVKGAKALRDRARRMVQEAEKRAISRAERIMRLEESVRIAREARIAYSSTKRGHGRETYKLKFKYKDFTTPLSARDVNANIEVTIDLGDTFRTPKNALISNDNSYDDLEVVAEGRRTSIWVNNCVQIYIFNKTAERIQKQLEKELRALKEASVW
jgi:hypothetical protein